MIEEKEFQEEANYMYPYDIIPGVKGVNMYVILICLGIVACFLVFSKLSDKLHIRAKIHNLALIGGVVGIGAGLGASVLFQALYNIAKLGHFEINNQTGATFYGGLIGGAAAFLAIYFLVGRFVIKDKIYLTSFFPLISCIAPAIAIAHGFGRLGCLFAGCCHGKLTEAFCGIMMHGDMGYERYVPVQLFEAIFLFVLSAYLIYRAIDRQKYNFAIYIVAYGVWRFVIEYARADYRGSTFVSFLTPSQLVAIVLIAAGIMLGLIEKLTDKKSGKVKSAEDSGEEKIKVNINKENNADE